MGSFVFLQRRKAVWGMVSMLNPSEKEAFSKVLEFQAISENSIWHIEGEPTDNTMKVIDALSEGKQVLLIPKNN